MTERKHGPGRRYVAMVTTAIVSVGTAAAVGWAAAVAVGGSASSGVQPARPATSLQAAQQIDAARTSLQQVRRDLTQLLSSEDDLPRAAIAKLSASLAQLPSVQVPQPSTQSPTQPTVTQVPAPPIHTTTGASGARP